MSVVEEKRKGKVAKYDQQFVRSISTQVLAAGYARNPTALGKRLARDSMFLTRLYDVSIHYDSFTRQVLDAVSMAGEDYDLDTVTYWVYRLALESETKNPVNAMPDEKVRLYSRAYLDKVAEWLAALDRVNRHDPVTLTLLAGTPDLAEVMEEREDEFGL